MKRRHRFGLAGKPINGLVRGIDVTKLLNFFLEHCHVRKFFRPPNTPTQPCHMMRTTFNRIGPSGRRGSISRHCACDRRTRPRPCLDRGSFLFPAESFHRSDGPFFRSFSENRRVDGHLCAFAENRSADLFACFLSSSIAPGAP